eukprot:6285487-Prymnesium_polylepis.1
MSAATRSAPLFFASSSAVPQSVPLRLSLQPLTSSSWRATSSASLAAASISGVLLVCGRAARWWIMRRRSRAPLRLGGTACDNDPRRLALSHLGSRVDVRLAGYEQLRDRFRIPLGCNVEGCVASLRPTGCAEHSWSVCVTMVLCQCGC